MNKYNNFFNIVQKDTDKSVVEKAYEMSLKNYSKEDIIRILSNNNDEIKLIAIINLKSIDNKDEALLILSHLTEQDGRIREAVSYILSENPASSIYMTDEHSKEIITKGLCDINPNVVRNLIDFLEKEQSGLKNELIVNITGKTNEVLSNLAEFLKGNPNFKENKEKSQKNHAKNKLTFNLYWLLTAISILNVNKIENLEEILTKTASFIDYTIREKTALILSKMKNPPKELLQKLQQDENIYVKNQLL